MGWLKKVSSVSEIYQMEMQAVIEVAKELVDKNKTVKVEQLFNVAKRRLKLNAEGLKQILKHLFDNKILVEGSKMIKSEVLSNEIRNLLYKFINKYPGVNFSALKKNFLREFGKNGFSIGTGQYIWHLEVLRKFNWLKTVKFKNYTLYCPYDMETEHVIYYFLMRNKINRKILSKLIENEPLKQAKLPNVINELKGSVYYHITTMKDVNLLLSEKKSGGLEVSIIPEKSSLIIEILGDVENKLHELHERKMSIKSKPKEVIHEKKPEVISTQKVEEKAETKEAKSKEEKAETKEEKSKEVKKKEPRKRVKTL